MGMSLPNWSQYQENAAEHFRGLGLFAETNVSIAGARAVHQIDGVVRFERAGIAQLWLVECKHYARPVAKEKVLAFRAVVEDVGADRGFLLSENGFQRGARAYAEKTNVLLTSLADLEVVGREEVFRVEVADLEARLRRAELRWRDMQPPPVLTAGGWTRQLPVLPRGSWPKGGPIALMGRMLELEEAIQQARFDDFPVLLSEPEADYPRRVGRGDFLSCAARLLSQIEGAVEHSCRPSE